ncbi:MAG: glycoside hydrolase family 20 zincin-like fold domain-containing protein [Planctomycetota bacterium]
MTPDDLLIPPAEWSALAGRFTWPDQPVLASPFADDLVGLDLLVGQLRRIGRRAAVHRSLGGATLQIARDVAIAHPEAYLLEIRPGAIRLTSRTAAGAYYGLATLRQLVASSAEAHLPCCRIEDAPAFARRGVYHDISRGKVPSLETLKHLATTLAGWKVNELQLYVENVFCFAGHPSIGQGYDPLKPEEIIQLQDHCRQHHIRLVGSLATFGHMERILQLPAYRHLAELPGYRDWPGGTTLCPTDPGSVGLVGDLLGQFVPLFEAGDFNLCGDEPWELGQGRSRSAVETKGKGRVYLEYMKQICRICRQLGKRPNLWSDIVLEHPELLGDWDKDVVMLNWDYHPDGERMKRTGEIADAGLELLVCPGTNSWNSHGGRLEMGRQNILSFAALGQEFEADGVLNTDWGDNGHRNMLAVSWANFAVGAAAAWQPDRAAEVTDWPERLLAQHVQLDRPGLADDIRTLATAHQQLGLDWANDTLTYFTLSQPAEDLLREDRPRGRVVDEVDPAALAGRIEALEALDFSPDPAARPDVADDLAEWDLARNQELAACHRAIFLQAMRQGKPPTEANVEGYLETAGRLGAQLPAVWTRRNRTSRLAGEIALLEAAIEHAEDLR